MNVRIELHILRMKVGNRKIVKYVIFLFSMDCDPTKSLNKNKVVIIKYYP